MQQVLSLHDFEVQVHLGCGDEERRYLQSVRFSLEIKLNSEVVGGKTDRLQDAVDYVELMNILKSKAKAKPYHLIEHLAVEATGGLLEFLRLQKVSGELMLAAHKVRVPVENLKGGVIFRCSEKI